MADLSGTTESFPNGTDSVCKSIPKVESGGTYNERDARAHLE